ncbi:MAG: filamentous hemagglutinin N-terminal domain-containing protein [Nostoc sp.]|uniref:two-partner secretion domain-containing protein n=1 Tax=Nostoc sp. TaxID=1180 RepID=UPI002FF3C73B
MYKYKKNQAIKQHITLFVKVSILFLLPLTSSSATAQVIPDITLQNNSLVSNQGNIHLIEGGTKAGNNLFHSFIEFSLPTGNTAYFNNALGIENIISRITGKSISNIDGLIRANGNANLLLINPNGIIFGNNARLDIGGSFIGTTANSIKFSNGSEFSAINPQSPTLLKINTPTGLQFGSNSNLSTIQVQNSGEGLIAPSVGSSPYIINNNTFGLRVAPGKTLALIGGNITLDGGILTAQDGRIELGSVTDNSIVSLTPLPQRWSLGYEKISSFGNIILSEKALLNTSGYNGGSLIMQGNNIFFKGGSTALIQSKNFLASGDINVNAINSLELSGTSPDGRFTSILRTEYFGSGNGNNIRISTKNLIFQGGANLSTRNYATGNGGNVIINAYKSIQLFGFSSFSPFFPSGISTSTLTSGKAGNITVSTENLLAQNGGFITSITRGSGTSGDVTINATNSTELFYSKDFTDGKKEYIDYIPISLSSEAVGTGNAGNLTIKTLRLLVGNEATVNTTTRGLGSAGSVSIDASNVEIRGGTINSSALDPSSSGQKIFRTPSVPSGSPGEVNINAVRLSLIDGGEVGIRNEGTNTAGGKLTINAASLSLDNKSTITATTTSGEGGNIFVNTRYLQLSNNSAVTTTAASRGNGGNININADILTAWKSSSITADALEGRGGNITINAQGLFFSPDSLITASSKYGINGTVKYNILDPNIYTTKIKAEVIPITPQITPVCKRQLGTGRSSFVVSSRNLQSKPNNLMYNNVEDRNSVTVPAFNNSHNPNSFFSNQPTQIIEANALIRDSHGNFILTTDQANPTWDNASLSASSCFPVSQ